MLLYRYQYKPQQPQTPSICSQGDRCVQMDMATSFFLHLQPQVGPSFWHGAAPSVWHTQLPGCRTTNPAAQSAPTPCLSTGHRLGTLTLALGPSCSPRDGWAPLASKSDYRHTQQFYSGFTPVCWEKVSRCSYSPKLLMFSNYTPGSSLVNVLCANKKKA